MRRALATLAILAASGGLGAAGCGAAPRSAAGGTLPASVVDPYLRIHQELAVDAFDNVRQNAGEIATAASALGAPAAKIDTAALQLAAAGDLAQARDRFGVLSDAIVTYMKASHAAAPQDVRTAFCPMAQRPWLQKGGTLANPYYGTSMPTCGEFR
jgi:Cu(I)/Ag(I) efflux system membrane fusion protein